MEPLPKPKETLKRFMLKWDLTSNVSAIIESEEAITSSIFKERESLKSS